MEVVTESGSEWPVVRDRYCLCPVGSSFCWQYSKVLMASVSIIYLSGDAFEVSQSCDAASMSGLAAVSWDHLCSSAVHKSILISLNVWVFPFISGICFACEWGKNTRLHLWCCCFSAQIAFSLQCHHYLQWHTSGKKIALFFLCVCVGQHSQTASEPW